ncbi:MAG: hypothetical protein U5L01_08270 [Rheinheimera sp.]|nr:hypothetical protein [Rheinheimera sp.]
MLTLAASGVSFSPQSGNFPVGLERERGASSFDTFFGIKESIGFHFGSLASKKVSASTLDLHKTSTIVEPSAIAESSYVPQNV